MQNTRSEHFAWQKDSFKRSHLFHSRARWCIVARDSKARIHYGRIENGKQNHHKLNLDSNQHFQACFCRGLNPVTQKREDMIAWLSLWNTVSKSVNGKSLSNKLQFVTHFFCSQTKAFHSCCTHQYSCPTIIPQTGDWYISLFSRQNVIYEKWSISQIEVVKINTNDDDKYILVQFSLFHSLFIESHFHFLENFGCVTHHQGYFIHCRF